MKITIVQGAFLPVPPKLGGAVEKMWYALGKEFVNRDHQVVHISRQYEGLPTEDYIDGVLHRRIRGHDTPSSGVYLKWLDFLYSLRVKKNIPLDSDIIITNTFWIPILLSASLQKRCMVDVQRMPKKQMILYKDSSCLRANSSPVANAIMKELPNESHHKVVTIPNPIPFQGLPNVDIKTKKQILLYVGRVHPEKGLELLIKAFKIIKPSWELQIVGPSDISAGGGGKSYLDFLKALAGNDNIVFKGPIYDIDELNDFYAKASIFVYPSIAEKGETFGLAPLEAMAWGCVPVVSKLPCFRDFIVHGVNGFVFDHTDHAAIDLLKRAIEELQIKTLDRNRMAQQAIKVRQTHSIGFIASLFLSQFEKIYKEHPTYPQGTS